MKGNIVPDNDKEGNELLRQELGDDAGDSIGGRVTGPWVFGIFQNTNVQLGRG